MEFVLVIPMILILLIGMVEVAVVARTSIELIAAAREGARVAATTPDTDRAIDATQQALGPELSNRVRITVRRPPVVGERARVTVALSHTVLSVLGGFRVPLEFSSVMRVEQ